MEYYSAMKRNFIYMWNLKKINKIDTDSWTQKTD